MPAYTKGNVSVTAPIVFPKLEKQSFNLKVDVLNITNERHNENEYISSGSYFSGLFPTSNYPTDMSTRIRRRQGQSTARFPAGPDRAGSHP